MEVEPKHLMTNSGEGEWGDEINEGIPEDSRFLDRIPE